MKSQSGHLEVVGMYEMEIAQRTLFLFMDRNRLSVVSPSFLFLDSLCDPSLFSPYHNFISSLVGHPSIRRLDSIRTTAVPPRFVEHFTSSDLEAPEDSPVSLRCVANGFPTPEIKWRREDGLAINIRSGGERGNTTTTQLFVLSVHSVHRTLFLS